jgi:hypothetical protein
MPHASESDRAQRTGRGRVVRPDVWRLPDRHILLGVSHASGDPARHRNFEVRASYDVESGGWTARVSEQNLNEQRGDWEGQLTGGGPAQLFPTPAACLGETVGRLIAIVDQQADDAP